MKKIVLTIAVALVSLGYMQAQTPDVTPVKSDSAVSTCQKVKSGLKKACEKTRNEVEQVGDTIADGTVTAYDKAKCGTKKSAGKIINGTEKAYDSTKNGVKKIGKKVADGTVSSFDEVKDGTVKAAKKVGSFSKKTYEKAKEKL